MEIARRSHLTREATYRMLSKEGNPELRSFTALLAGAGLRLIAVARAGCGFNKEWPQLPAIINNAP